MKINSTLWFVLLFIFGIHAVGFIGSGVAVKYYLLFTTDQIAPTWVYLYLSLPGYISLTCYVITTLVFTPKPYQSPEDEIREALSLATQSRLAAEIQLGMTKPIKPLDQITEETVAAIHMAINTAKKNQK